MNASEILATASNLVGGDRAKQHGDKKTNHANIAALWSAYLRRRLGEPVELRPSDVAHMMVLLKMARTLTGVHNPDDSIDAVGYSAIAGELLHTENMEQD